MTRPQATTERTGQMTAYMVACWHTRDAAKLRGTRTFAGGEAAPAGPYPTEALAVRAFTLCAANPTIGRAELWQVDDRTFTVLRTYDEDA